MILLGALSVDGRVALPAQRGLPVLRVLGRWGAGVRGQGAGRDISRAWAVVIASAQGQAGSMWRVRRRGGAHDPPGHGQEPQPQPFRLVAGD